MQQIPHKKNNNPSNYPAGPHTVVSFAVLLAMANNCICCKNDDISYLLLSEVVTTLAGEGQL